MQLTQLSYFEKIVFLWQYDANFTYDLVTLGAILIIFLIVNYVWGINYLYQISPGGQVYGDSKLTYYPSWIFIGCIILGTLLYINWRVCNTIFVDNGVNVDGSIKVLCKSSVRSRDFIGTIGAVAAILVWGYVFWYKDQ